MPSQKNSYYSPSRRKTIEVTHGMPCSGEPEPHVIYDYEAAGYRAQVRCRCKEINEVSKRLHTKPEKADGEAIILHSLMMEKETEDA